MRVVPRTFSPKPFFDFVVLRLFNRRKIVYQAAEGITVYKVKAPIKEKKKIRVNSPFNHRSRNKNHVYS